MNRKHPLSAALAVTLLLAVFSAMARTGLESPEVTSHRTALMLDIKGTHWETPWCFNGEVEAKNQAARDTQLSVVISGPGGSYRKEVAIPAGQTVRFPVYAPMFGGAFDWRRYKVDFHQPGDNATYHWTDFGSDSRDPPLIRPRNPAELPTEPRRYWGFPTLSLTPEQWLGLTPVHQGAIRAWVELGGHLHFTPVVGQSPPSGPGVPTSNGRGQVTSGAEPEAGRIPDFANPGVAITLPWTMAELPRWMLIVCTAIFSLMIGPGVFWLCQRRHHPALALLVIPAVSLTACLMMLLLSLFHDGITPKVCRQTLTLLDQGAGLAVTSQILGIEAPLGLFRPIVFPEDALVRLPQNGNASPRCEVVGGELQIRAAVLPRTPACFAMLHQEPRRERLEVRREGDRLIVVNGLGATVEQLRLCDGHGEFWHNSAALPPGRAADLIRGLAPQAPAPCASPLLGQLREPSPGHYLAFLDRPAFAAPTIVGGRTVGENFSVVAGKYE